MAEILDSVDAKILDLIQVDAGLSVAEIAERVGLSSSPAWRRIKRLEDTGVIQRRVTLLDREKLGLDFEVYAEIKLALPTKENLDAFDAAVQDWPEVVHCSTVTGAMDYVLRIVTRDIHAFDTDGAPLLLLSRLAQHTKNLLADPRVSLLFDGAAGLDDPLAGPV